ncbi:MAG: hypothetical protein ACLRT5_01150 [Lachnospiraceae bacterium]
MQDPSFLQDLTPEVTEEGLLVSGNPQEVASLLDYAQGDNPYNASGNCGLVSVSNVLEMAGLENCGEDEVTLYALETNQCANDPSLASADRGGTNRAKSGKYSGELRRCRFLVLVGCCKL